VEATKKARQTRWAGNIGKIGRFEAVNQARTCKQGGNESNHFYRFSLRKDSQRGVNGQGVGQSTV